MSYKPRVVELPSEHDKVLAKEVASVLMNVGHMFYISFTYAGAIVSYYQFLKVAKHILDGHMFISREAGRKDYAAYEHFVDAMFFPEDFETSSWSSKGNIVHESVHAICDMHSKTMNTIDAEMMGYVAQAMYLRKNSPDFNAGQSPALQDDVSDLRVAAFALGDAILKGGSAAGWTTKLMQPLKVALGKGYKGRSKWKVKFNGLGSNWRLGKA